MQSRWEQMCLGVDIPVNIIPQVDDLGVTRVDIVAVRTY
jgi:hypothetical protein